VHVIDWTHWPAQQRPTRAFFAALVVLVSVAAFSYVGRVYGVIAAFVLLTATAESFFPTRFRLTDEGVEAFNLFRRARRPWSRFESWRRSDEGYYLRGQGPLALIARRRSLWLPCPELYAPVGAFLSTRLKEAP
jgi:hypothetical protein